jgi:hyperosmotically inducible periplasmic protein
MKKISTLLASVVLAGALCNASQTQPDNTKVNQRDRNKAQPTADQGKNNKSDREIMKEIRRSVVSDKSLSTYAHNVKIISQGGKVTLKGPVHTEEEKKSIESKASAVAGDGNVTNQLTVKASSK